MPSGAKLGITIAACALAAIGCGKRAAPAPGMRAGTIAQAVTAPPVSTNASNFNGTAISSGRHIWFTSVVKVNGVGSSPVHLFFNGSHIQFSADGASYDLPVPAAEITIDPAATTATTQFDTTLGQWVTVVPKNFSGNVFLTALSYSVPVNLPGGINPVTWLGSFQSDTAGVSVNWLWAAAVYTQFSIDYTALGVKPVDDNHVSAYQNSDHAGTSEAFKTYVTGGARGGGGSDYTGSLSGTVTPTLGSSCQGIVCTAADACHLVGSCDVATELCSNPAAPAGTACSDGNACNGNETCDGSGACAAGPAPPVDDGNPCTVDACDVATGITHVAVANGTACNDGNACTSGDVCTTGSCGGTAVAVDDGNPCTVDACSPATGVSHVPASVGTSCSDGNDCNGSEACNGDGTCAAGTPPPVDDGNPCTVDTCDPATGVHHTPASAGTSCSDGNACNGAETCDAGGTCTGSDLPKARRFDRAGWSGSAASGRRNFGRAEDGIVAT